MRTRQEVQDRLKALLSLEINRRLADTRQKQPHTCQYNLRHPLDTRPTVEGAKNPNLNRIVQPGTRLPVLQTVGLCMYGSGELGSEKGVWPGDICEDVETSRPCNLYVPMLTSKQAALELRAELEDAEHCRIHYPEIAALIWTLEGYVPATTWLQQLWYYFFPPVLKALPSQIARLLLT